MMLTVAGVSQRSRRRPRSERGRLLLSAGKQCSSQSQRERRRHSRYSKRSMKPQEFGGAEGDAFSLWRLTGDPSKGLRATAGRTQAEERTPKAGAKGGWAANRGTSSQRFNCAGQAPARSC